MKTTKETCWAEVFPSLPICAIPKNLPENITPDELIRFASYNVKSIVDSWTCAIRFQ